MRVATAFGTARIGIGVATWVAPAFTTRIFGLGSDDRQEIVGQLFGARETVLVAAGAAAFTALGVLALGQEG